MEQENLSPQLKRRIVREVKKKTLSTSKKLKSLVDAPGSTRTIRRHLNDKNIKHKERIHRPTSTRSTKRNDWNMLINIKPRMLKNGEKLFSRTKRYAI